MGFTVVYPGGIDDLRFAPCYRLLVKRGWDIADLKRVAEPETRCRWLPVWDRREEAEEFAAELRKTSRDSEWSVHELGRDDAVSQGPLGPIEVAVGRQMDGWAFGLKPLSKGVLERRYPGLCRVQGVFIAKWADGDYEWLQGEGACVLDQVARLLTGLSPDQLREFGGYRVYDPVRHQVVRESELAGQCSIGGQCDQSWR